MITPHKEPKRHKVNFMIDKEVMMQIIQWVPAGERSDFVNAALQAAIKKMSREKAFELMDELRKKTHIKMSIQEMIERKNYGRP